jgi:hypothetical protein
MYRRSTGAVLNFLCASIICSLQTDFGTYLSRAISIAAKYLNEFPALAQKMHETRCVEFRLDNFSKHESHYFQFNASFPELLYTESKGLRISCFQMFSSSKQKVRWKCLVYWCFLTFFDRAVPVETIHEMFFFPTNKLLPNICS